MDEDMLREFLLSQMGTPSFGGPGGGKDVTTAEQARQGNLLQDIMQLLTDPAFALTGAAFGVDGGVNYDQLVEPPQEFVPPPTPTFDSYRQAAAAGEDDVYRLIVQAVEMGAPRADIAQIISDATKNDGTDGERKKLYMADLDSMLSEIADVRKAESEWVAQPRELSPLEKTFRDAGLPSPLQRYTKGDFDPSGELARTREAASSTKRKADDAAKLADELRRRMSAQRSGMGESTAQQYIDLGFSDKQISDVQKFAEGGMNVGGGRVVRARPVEGAPSGGGEVEWDKLNREFNRARTNAAVTRGTSERARVLERMANAGATARRDGAEWAGRTPLNDAIKARMALIRQMGLGV